MKHKVQYTEKVPESEQIPMNRFPLLPGDIGIFAGEQNGDYISGKFTELRFANPEFLKAKEQRLKKSDFPPNAGTIKFTEDQRSECEDFLRNDIKVQYKRSICAIIELNISIRETYKGKLYTYDILNMVKSGQLVITSKNKLN